MIAFSTLPKGGEVSGVGVILIGPFPIVFTTSPDEAWSLLLLLLPALAFAAFVLLLLRGMRR